MDKEFLFGWLIKGRCEVSFLDGVILICELVSIYFIYLFVCYIRSLFKEKR